METARRLLIVRLTAIGDVVHALPAANALRRHCPDARIDWLVDRRAAAMLDGAPWLDRVMVLRGKGMFTRPWRAVQAVRELRQRRYDAVFDLQGLFKSALLTSLARTRETVGMASRELRESAAAGMYSRQMSPPGPRAAHVIGRGLAMVGEWLGRDVLDEPWEFFSPAAPGSDAARRESDLRQRLAVPDADDTHPAGDCPLIVLNPGAAWMTKRWPPDRFAELAHQLLARPLPDGRQPRLMITWGPGEEAARDTIVRRISPLLRPRVFDFPTALADLVPLFRIAALFVGGDTGPMQIAAATGTPVVSLFGPTWPDRNGPFAPADRDATLWHRLPCSGCYGKRCPLDPSRDRPPRCIDGIPVDEVLAAVVRRLARSDAGR